MKQYWIKYKYKIEHKEFNNLSDLIIDTQDYCLRRFYTIEEVLEVDLEDYSKKDLATYVISAIME